MNNQEYFRHPNIVILFILIDYKIFFFGKKIMPSGKMLKDNACRLSHLSDMQRKKAQEGEEIIK
jgi:hypothetical protein